MSDNASPAKDVTPQQRDDLATLIELQADQPEDVADRVIDWMRREGFVGVPADPPKAGGEKDLENIYRLQRIAYALGIRDDRSGADEFERKIAERIEALQTELSAKATVPAPKAGIDSYAKVPTPTVDWKLTKAWRSRYVLTADSLGKAIYNAECEVLDCGGMPDSVHLKRADLMQLLCALHDVFLPSGGAAQGGTTNG